MQAKNFAFAQKFFSRYDDPQLPFDGGCLWSGNALDQGSDVPG
jgi:hypothetical protein